MAVESINAQAKEALTNALETAGYKVYPNILDRHTGVRTKSVEYVELGRGFLRTSDEITDECIQGEFQIEMKYYKPNTWNTNNGANDLTFEDCCIQVEKSISQVKTPGMFTRFNMDKEFPTTPHNRGKECRWVLSCTVASRQDRGEVAGPPINTAAPVVTGLGFEGQTLTTTDGSWTGSQPITYSYDWQANGVSLGAADQNTYVVGAGLEGQTITCVVTASNTFGDVAATSNGILIETAAAPVNTVAPVVTPDPPTEGDLLTSTDGTWTGNPAPTFTYQWYKDDGAGGAFSAIGGATSSTYQTTVGDAGFKFYCEVTGANFVNSASADSNTVTAQSAGIVEFPIATDALWCRDLAYNSFLGSDTVTQRRTSDNNEIGVGFAGVTELFDTATWSTHTSAGADPAYCSVGYDQNATYNAIQTTAAAQPLVNSNGTLTFDGSDDELLINGFSFTSSTQFTFAMVWSSTVITPYLFSSDMLTVRNNAIDQLRIQGGGGAGGRNVAVTNLNDGNKKLIIVTYDTAAGYTLNVNNVDYPVSATSGSAVTGSNTIYIMSFGSASTQGPGDVEKYLFKDGVIWTAQNKTDAYNWVNDRGLLS